MLLNALTNYLQNQPGPSELKTSAAEATAPISDVEKASTDNSLGLYEVSNRAVMVSAVAAEFNISELPPEQLEAFQNRLEEFGLIDRVGISALSLVHTARRDIEDGDNTINAKAIVDKAYQASAEPGTSYSQRQQIQQLHTLFSNIDSARPH